jgi:hypothetical protein
MVTQQKLAAAQINAGVITQADYTVYVRNVSDEFKIDERGALNEFFSHYGQVTHQPIPYPSQTKHAIFVTTRRRKDVAAGIGAAIIARGRVKE